MSRIVIRGGRLVTPAEERFADLVIEDGMVKAVGGVADNLRDAELFDASGCFVTPGLIDLQVNGAPSCDFWGDPTLSDVDTFAAELVKAGVTTILPTLITDDLEHFAKNIAFLEKEVGVGVAQLDWNEASRATEAKSGKRATAVKDRQPLVRMPGIHLEGPCLSPERPGVHPKEHIRALSKDAVKAILSSSVSLVTCAPETDKSGEGLKELVSANVKVALGHSNATYEEAQVAFDSGVSMMTHTFNALPAIHHRAPGAVTAALLNPQIVCCLICDGHHVSPPAAELVLRTKGVNKTVLVTDIAATGTSQGGLVGSSILLDQAIRNVVEWKIASFPQAIAMATLNPAKAMGWDDKVGSLTPRKQADVVLWDQKTLQVQAVFVGGRRVV